MNLKSLVLFAALVCGGAYARLTHHWTHAELAIASDMIAIVEAVSSQKTDISVPASFPLDADKYQAWVTTFKVHTLLKSNGNLEGPLQIIHFQYSDKVKVVTNGAQFMNFTIGPVKQDIVINHENGGRAGITSDNYRPLWLAYLTKRPDGRFAPASGDYDADQAFKELSDHAVH